MKKVAFDNKVLKRLKEGWKQDETFYIVGVTGDGKSVIQNMKIATNRDSGMHIYGNDIYFESADCEDVRGLPEKPFKLGDHIRSIILPGGGVSKRREPSNKLTEYIARFETELDSVIFSSSMYLLGIKDMVGNTIYENEKGNQILEATQKNGEEMAQKRESWGRLPIPELDDGCCEFLSKYIGKPISFGYDTQGILTHIDGYDSNGALIVGIMSEDYDDHYSISARDPKCKVWNKGKQISFETTLSKEELEKLIEQRKAKMNEAEKKNKKDSKGDNGLQVTERDLWE